MARLPQPGQDAGNWGNLLNDFLSTTHDSNGNLKQNSVNTAALADGAVTLAKLAISNNPTTGQTLSYNGTGLAWSTPSSSGSVPDATSSVKGLVQLTGDLGGTSAAPTVPGLATKADTSTVVTLAGSQTVTGAKNFTGALQSNGVAVVTTGDARLTDTRTPSDDSITTIKLKDNSITEPKLAIANTASTSQVLSWNGTALAWANPTSGGSGDPTMGGDLSGVASNATINTDAVTTAKILNLNVTTAKIADSAITEPKLAVTNSPATNQVLSWNGTALAWVTPASGGGGNVWNAVAKTANYTAVSGDFIVCDTTSAGFTITLPAATNGAYVTVKKKTNNVNAVLVAPPSGTIDAGQNTSSTISINSYGQVADFLSDGTTWHQVG